jgi:hypothetical protein
VTPSIVFGRGGSGGQLLDARMSRARTNQHGIPRELPACSLAPGSTRGSPGDRSHGSSRHGRWPLSSACPVPTVKIWRNAGLLRAERYNDKGECLYARIDGAAPRKQRGKKLSDRRLEQKVLSN